MGWPPCGKTMVHWFSTKERGPGRVGVEHRAQRRRRARRQPRRRRRAAVRRLGREVLLQRDGRRRRGAASRSSCCATRRSRAACRRSRSTRTTTRPTTAPTTSATFTFREIFFEHVLNNKYLWAIAVANAFVYFVRYGVVNWIPTYLRDGQGILVPAVERGLVAVRVRRDPRAPSPAAGCRTRSSRAAARRRRSCSWALTLVAVVVYWLNINGPLWIDYAALIAIGFLIYGPIMIIGLHALDLVPKKAAGTAAGFTGFFGYVFGSAIAGHGRRLDRRPLGLERRVRHDGRLLRADDRLQRDDARPHRHQPQAGVLARHRGQSRI